MRVKVKVEKKKPKEVVTALVCPDCRGTDVVVHMGFITGRKYECQDCGYLGAFILERTVVVHEDETVEEL
jgi:predicted RNA-binding Zn-ribbon protein involved in translation (DUF1610 family)